MPLPNQTQQATRRPGLPGSSLLTPHPHPQAPAVKLGGAGAPSAQRAHRVQGPSGSHTVATPAGSGRWPVCRPGDALPMQGGLAMVKGTRT